jgi:Ca2+-binding RTX toxin-like protein
MPKTKLINGTSGNDELYGDISGITGTLSGKGGNQTINGLGGDDTLYGDAHLMNGKAHGGNDIINGADGNDTLYGDAYEMHQNAGRQ